MDLASSLGISKVYMCIHMYTCFIKLCIWRWQLCSSGNLSCGKLNWNFNILHSKSQTINSIQTMRLVKNWPQYYRISWSISTFSYVNPHMDLFPHFISAFMLLCQERIALQLNSATHPFLYAYQEGIALQQKSPWNFVYHLGILSHLGLMPKGFCPFRPWKELLKLSDIVLFSPQVDWIACLYMLCDVTVAFLLNLSCFILAFIFNRTFTKIMKKLF